MGAQQVAPTYEDVLQALRDRGRTRQELEIVLRSPQITVQLHAARNAGHIAPGPRNRWTLTKAGRLHLDQLDEATNGAACRALEHMVRGNRGLALA